MPITRKQFESGQVLEKKTKANRWLHPVAKFLRKNHMFAYRAVEISKAIKMKEDTVRSMLAELKKDRLIMHKTPRFIWKIKKKVKAKKKKK